MDPHVLQASANIVAAAAQLTAIVRPPPLTLLTQSVQVSSLTACLICPHI